MLKIVEREGGVGEGRGERRGGRGGERCLGLNRTDAAFAPTHTKKYGSGLRSTGVAVDSAPIPRGVTPVERAA